MISPLAGRLVLAIGAVIVLSALGLLACMLASMRSREEEAAQGEEPGERQRPAVQVLHGLTASSLLIRLPGEQTIVVALGPDVCRQLAQDLLRNPGLRGNGP